MMSSMSFQRAASGSKDFQEAAGDSKDIQIAAQGSKSIKRVTMIQHGGKQDTRRAVRPTAGNHVRIPCTAHEMLG